MRDKHRNTQFRINASMDVQDVISVGRMRQPAQATNEDHVGTCVTVERIKVCVGQKGEHSVICV